MRALAIAVVVSAAATAQAAPWSFELPAGYTEVVAGADDTVMELRNQASTVSADGQHYRSSDATVTLTRVTWQFRVGQLPTRTSLIHLERESVDKGASPETGDLVAESRQFANDQLSAEATYELAGRRTQHRRLYSADTDGVVHLFSLKCEGPTDQLAACLRALQSMQLTLPNQAPLVQYVDKVITETDVTYWIGVIAGAVIVIAIVVVWIVIRRRKR